MAAFLKLVSLCRNAQAKYLKLPTRNIHFRSPSSEPRTLQKTVSIFWDFDNKPPNPTPPFQAALNLRKTASCFGLVRHMIAYANPSSLASLPRQVGERMSHRKALNELENKGLVRPVEPYRCGVCGRNFFNHEKFVTHFKTIHERENSKRVSQIESARGARRVNLVGKYSMKMEKYKRACQDLFLGPKKEAWVEDELGRAGFRVVRVSEETQAVDFAMRRDIVDFLDKRRFEFLVVVSDDSDFVSVVEEARMRCVRTVVVGNSVGGALKRVADKGFLWREVLSGKANKEAGPVLGRWRDRDVLKRLEWRYDRAVERRLDADGCDREIVGGQSKDWWELQD